jgi:hypothetical protein
MMSPSSIAIAGAAASSIPAPMTPALATLDKNIIFAPLLE